MECFADLSASRELQGNICEENISKNAAAQPGCIANYGQEQDGFEHISRNTAVQTVPSELDEVL